MHRPLKLLSLFTFIVMSLVISEATEQKLILSSHKNEQSTKEDLLRLKVYFIENAATRMLKEKYLFKFHIESYGEYQALMISPIKDDSLRNELLVLLSPQFPDIFYVIGQKKSVSESMSPLRTVPSNSTSTLKTSLEHPKKENMWFDVIGLEWLSIWILAVIGLILSIRNRSKMGQLERTQKEIKVKQTNIEEEMTQLGEENA